MAPRLRKISNLYYKFIQGTALEGRMHAEDVGRCLRAAGLIEYCTNEHGLLRYRELPKLYEVDQTLLMDLLKQYAETLGHEGDI